MKFSKNDIAMVILYLFTKQHCCEHYVQDFYTFILLFQYRI